MSLIEDTQVAALLAEVSDFGIFALDTKGICTDWMPISSNYQLVPAEEIVGHPLDKFYGPEEQKLGLYWDNLKTAKEKGRCDTEGLRRRWDGTYSWTRISLVKRLDEAGDHVGYLGVAYDATRQRDAARALHASEEAFKTLINGLRDHAIYMLSHVGRITNWNAGAEQIKGYTAEEVLGQHFSIFFTDDERGRGVPDQILEQARVAGRYREEGWRLRKNGEKFRAEVSIQAIHDEHGEIRGFGAITRDITEQYDAKRNLAAAQEALNQSEKLRSLGELTGGIAHDFNNLLTVVRGSAELLKSQTLSADKKTRHIDAIVETADRAAELTGQLLSFARQQPLQPKRIDLNDLISGMSELMRRTLGGGVSILQTPSSGLWEVRADPTQLENLILNAAINARDAMDGAGTLTLATHNVDGKEGDEVCLSISDTGSGIEPELLERVFEPFFTTKGPGKGTGLGLSQAYGFAAQSGGRLEISSEVGSGTTLSLYLPRAEAKPNMNDAARRRKAGRDVPRGTRVLLVEDSRTVAVFAQSLLEDMGCDVMHAKNAEEALIALENEPDEFDIIFSDIVMPGLSGLDLAAQVRSQKPTLPILLATGYSEAAARGEGSEFPILPKPYKRDILSAKLCETMNAFGEAA
ncbi:PAS domain S-box protein [Parasphingopyxis algicola]|uniref:hybrid sensor histidine kinase/response regulator n=1 Tax=Parasphingopyxis algicola TaxID=2026624 RepID=UPI0015A4644B|nr:PAS domain-containing sensor histidine kinase [Parasphingopyxis algicola]QLC25150.1 PAS domain S-box protein [Parasphingopyxis algicola]